ncbi:hypothetical protein NQ315_003347, partial [Exocentrus adspersus]
MKLDNSEYKSVRRSSLQLRRHFLDVAVSVIYTMVEDHNAPTQSSPNPRCAILIQRNLVVMILLCEPTHHLRIRIQLNRNGTSNRRRESFSFNDVPMVGVIDVGRMMKWWSVTDINKSTVSKTIKAQFYNIVKPGLRDLMILGLIRTDQNLEGQKLKPQKGIKWKWHNLSSKIRIELLEKHLKSFKLIEILKIIKFHPYKIHLHHEINEDDPDRRLEFCDNMMERIAQNHNYSSFIVFSDESTFQLNGE